MKNLADLADLCPTMLVAQSVMSATDTLGYGMYVAFLPQILIQDSGLASTLGPRMLACFYIAGVGNHPPHVCGGDNTTPISNAGVS